VCYPFGSELLEAPSTARLDSGPLDDSMIDERSLTWLGRTL
jgi:hypothetical protein